MPPRKAYGRGRMRGRGVPRYKGSLSGCTRMPRKSPLCTLVPLMIIQVMTYLCHHNGNMCHLHLVLRMRRLWIGIKDMRPKLHNMRRPNHQLAKDNMFRIRLLFMVVLLPFLRN
ncbi:hypothetical protein COLO4_06775 [Corchorus olitorius]|uniref:Uncharacterized protein n=1 Tax=Corchorus olitorius TaxID=93759 RepID=A0A1R3KM31_9ROSI|nr:hypothetical protein COLO4_06775 [Corchorus olitorius]